MKTLSTIAASLLNWVANAQTIFIGLVWWKQVLMVGTLSMLYIFFVGWLGVLIIPPVSGWGPGVPPIPELDPRALIGLFVRWDSGYYIDIVQHGYTVEGDERAFFPLYPLIVRGISRLTTLPILWSGWLISISAYLMIGLVMYRWARLDYAPNQALFTTAILYTFPMAFYYLAFYAEPLFMLFSLQSIYQARRGRFLLSGLAIALAGATRPQAFLLGVPYVIEFFLQHNFTRSAWARFVAGALMAPVGMLTYLLFITRSDEHLHEPYLNLLERGWDTLIAWPWVTLADGLNAALFGQGIAPTWFSRAYAIHDLLYAFLGLALSIWAFRRLRPSVGVFLFVGVLTFYTTHGPVGHAFDSMPRHLANLPAVYLALGLLQNHLSPRLRWAMLGFFALQLGIIAAWFASGRWVS